MGMGPAQPRWPRAPLPCLSPPIGQGWVRPFSGMACSAGSMPRVSAWVAGFPNGTSGSCTMSTSSAVPAGGVVQARAGEMLAPKSRPRCRCGMGVPWSKAGLVRVKLSGACRSGRAQTRVWWPARRLRSARPRGLGMGSVPSFFLTLAGGPAWAAEFSVEDGKSDGDDADADHNEGDEVDAAVADAGMEDDSGDGGGGDGADVAEGAEQPGCDTQLLGWRLGVEGDLVAACRGAERDAEEQGDQHDPDDVGVRGEEQHAGGPHQAGQGADDDRAAN